MLTVPDGWIRFLIYAGSADKEVSGSGHVKKVVDKLMSGLLEKDRLIYMKITIIVDLPIDLLDQQTHGTRTLCSS